MSSNIRPDDRLQAVLRGAFCARQRPIKDILAHQPKGQQAPPKGQQAPPKGQQALPKRQQARRLDPESNANSPPPKSSAATTNDVKSTMVSARSIAQSYIDNGGEVIDLFSAFAGVVFTANSSLALSCLKATDRWVCAKNAKAD
jgi:hypothetical protein